MFLIEDDDKDEEDPKEDEVVVDVEEPAQDVDDPMDEDFEVPFYDATTSRDSS